MAAAAKHSAPSAAEEPLHKRPKIAPDGARPQVALNRVDCNLDFTVEEDGLSGSGLHGEGFAYCWSGARASLGVKGGRYCFACKVIQNQHVTMEDTGKDQQNLCRVGISRGDDDVGSLGESEHSFGYGGTGKFSNHGTFLDYGGKFGVGDTILCAVDLESKPKAKIAFSKNGKWLGVAKEFDIGPKGHGITGVSGRKLSWEGAFFPHVLLKNVKIRMLFSVDHGLIPLEGYKPWDAALQDGNAIEGPKLGDNNNCEVVMMVGLPGSGKTTWAEKWAREHPEKRYMLLGTNLALDQMKVPGLMRKKNYGERFDRLMDRASKIFNKLLERAANTPRNYILDQTNVYRNARMRKLKPFKGFYKIAVVVFPTPEQLKQRTIARTREMGKEVPLDAVNEMLVNYILPKSKGMLNSIEPFDEVWFPEVQREEAEQFLVEMKSAVPPRPPNKSESKPTQPSQGSFQDRNSKEGSHASVKGNSKEGSHASVKGNYYVQGNYPVQREEAEQSLVEMKSAISSRPPYKSESIPTQSFQGSFQDRNSREGSHVSAQGNYASPYTFQGSFEDRYSREASLGSFHGNYDYSSPYSISSLGVQGSYSSAHKAAYAAPYGAGQGASTAAVGRAVLDQPLHSVPLVGDYHSGLPPLHSSQLPRVDSSTYHGTLLPETLPYRGSYSGTDRSSYIEPGYTDYTHQYHGGDPRTVQMQSPAFGHVGGAMVDMKPGRLGAPVWQSPGVVEPYPSNRPVHGVPPMPSPQPGWGHPNYRY